MMSDCAWVNPEEVRDCGGDLIRRSEVEAMLVKYFSMVDKLDLKSYLGAKDKARALLSTIPAAITDSELEEMERLAEEVYNNASDINDRIIGAAITAYRNGYQDGRNDIEFKEL